MRHGLTGQILSQGVVFIHTDTQTHVRTHTQYEDNVTELIGSNKVPNLVNNIHVYHCATTAH